MVRLTGVKGLPAWLAEKDPEAFWKQTSTKRPEILIRGYGLLWLQRK